MKSNYSIKRCPQPVVIDADWDKQAWRDVEPIEVSIPHWPTQTDHLSKTQVKVQYDDQNLYVIFQVADKYVRAVATQMHGSVWEDSCVELFFAPHVDSPTSYFNLEINCRGVMLMQHHTGPRTNTRFLKVDDCKKINIASSISAPIANEITEPIIWTLEYALPFDILLPYAAIDKPAPGVSWRANFYKCADESSHPHWMAWSKIDLADPDFHRPDFFASVTFE